jgi:ParB family chromosome partitioning protein
VLVGRLVQEKLESAALAVEMQEGWSWSLAREGAVRNYGDDREHYLVLPEPEGELSADEQQRLDELYATQEATATYEDEAAIQVLIDEIEEAASIRAWTPEQKAACGVVVSLSDGELCIQRGVQKKVQEAVADGRKVRALRPMHVVASSTPDVAEGISVPLLKKCRPRERWRYRRNWCGSHRKPWP